MYYILEIVHDKNKTTFNPGLEGGTHTGFVLQTYPVCIHTQCNSWVSSFQTRVLWWFFFVTFVCALKSLYPYKIKEGIFIHSKSSVCTFM